MIFLYLIGLVGAISCIALIDWRYKLAFFYDKRRTIVTLVTAIALFIVWDILGIKLGIFFHGGSPFSLPVRLLPEFPIEELFFLLLLTYVSLIIYRFVQEKVRL
jgi:lycopene cyclase domain-containing protein